MFRNFKVSEPGKKRAKYIERKYPCVVHFLNYAREAGTVISERVLRDSDNERNYHLAISVLYLFPPPSPLITQRENNGLVQIFFLEVNFQLAILSYGIFP